MGETIAFPDEYHRLVRAGKKALESHQHIKATKYLKQAVLLEQTFEVNHLLVEALCMNNQFEEALELADQYFAGYFESPERFMEYFHLLLLNRQYLQARHYQIMVLKHRDFPKEVFQETLSELRQLESVVDLVDPEVMHHKRNLLFELDRSMRPVSPRQWQELTRNISLENFESLMAEFLPLVSNPFLRPRVVEELVGLGSGEIMTVKDLYGQLQQVKPSLLQLPEKSPALEIMIRYIEEHLGNQDPILAEGIISEIQAHYVLAYPFNPQDEDPQTWSRSYLMEYQEPSKKITDLNLLYLKIQKEKTTFREIYQQLM